MSEARLVESEKGGLIPEGEGWFVLNAKDARWLSGELGTYVPWEGVDEARFPQLGINLNVLQPGEPMTMYHRENAQEDFLVLARRVHADRRGGGAAAAAMGSLPLPGRTSPHAVVGAGDRPVARARRRARTGSDGRRCLLSRGPRCGAVERRRRRGNRLACGGVQAVHIRMGPVPGRLAPRVS